MDTLDWLKSLCGKTATTKAPFFASIDGRRHVCATNGHAIVLLRCDEFPELPPSPFDVQMVIPKGGDRYSLSLSDLIVWAREGRVGARPCGLCDGKKMLECSARCWNPDTEEVHGKHWTECGRCKGTGISNEEPRPARIGGVVFDRNFVADFAGNLNGDRVDLQIETNDEGTSRENGTLALRTGEAIVVIVGMREAPQTPHPAFDGLTPVPAEKVG